jgi:hypothetical protein
MINLENMIQKYFITAFQSNAHVNNVVLQTIEKYMAHNNIPQDNLYLIKLSGKNINEEQTPKTLNLYNIIDGDVKLNSNFKIGNFSVAPQQIRPFTGLDSFTRTDGSFVFGNPKQYFKSVPTHDKKHAKVLYTTGVITYPNYNMRHRVGRIAHKDHTYGGLYVEVVNNKLYHARHITFTEKGLTFDLGFKYSRQGVQVVRPEALVLGDWHTGMTDKYSREASFDMITSYQPKRVVFHDFFDGASINHHEEGKLIERVFSYNNNRLNLEQELRLLVDELKTFVKITHKDSKIYIVKSNHDEFLYRYLNEARFIKEPQNAYLASKLLTKALEGKDPLVEGIKMFYVIPKKVIFLGDDDSLRVGRWELGKHGHKGVHGAKGSLRSYERASPHQITGHKHCPEKERNQLVVGTNSILDPAYAKGGLSGWMACNALVYNSNIAQLIPIINGCYKEEN